MRRLALAALTITMALVGGVFVAAPAHAIQKASYSLSYCHDGTFKGTGKNELSNGTLSFGWCAKNGGATTITVKYSKHSGSDVRIRLGYEWVNSNGGAAAGRHWDQSSGSTVTAKAGETWSARFQRNPPQQPPSSLSKCLRGLMLVDGTTVYSTYVVCP
ncbi:MAG: hypothetical protein ACK4V6_18085 [Microthrixaceae bacterium]